MYGAILGDIIGSPYEFLGGPKSKAFPLFAEHAAYTDDTVMTVAVTDALLESRGQGDGALREAVVQAMQRWGRKYPYAGYGTHFESWLWEDRPAPYFSYGNGSAMRVSSVGWMFDTLEETRRAAGITAEVTHNHPEGVKGAQAVACAVFLARTGESKRAIRDFIAGEFGYDLSRTCDEIRPGYSFDVSCQGTVPPAVAAFLEGISFQDVIRTAVSLGGDCDTLTCIAGSMAEAYYEVPPALVRECRNRLPEDMLRVIDRFEQAKKQPVWMAEGGTEE